MYNTSVVVKNEDTMMGFDMVADELVKGSSLSNYKKLSNLVKAVTIDLDNFNISYQSFVKYYSFITMPQVIMINGVNNTITFINALINAQVICSTPAEELALAAYINKLDILANELTLSTR